MNGDNPDGEGRCVWRNKLECEVTRVRRRQKKSRRLSEVVDGGVSRDLDRR